MKSSRYVFYAGAIAAVLVFALIASFQFRDSNPVAASPSPGATSPSPSASATGSSVPTTTTATPSPVATASAAPTPVGFVLPQSCRYVSFSVQADSSWAFDCGAAANADGKIIQAALVQQGWPFCGGAGGRDIYTKGTMTIYIEKPGSAPGALPTLTQSNQRVGNCP